MKLPTLIKAALLIAFILLLTLYGIAPLILPQPVPATSSLARFSGERAMSHVQVLAQTPRVVGSTEMVITANYLEETLRSYGLKPEILESSSVKGSLLNVVVRIPGRDSSRALLILTHSDSVSFGAGDNASGVAVLLETARALQKGAQPRNDIILLFDDGEEQGYWGGYAFAQTQPWMKNIRCVIGLDTAAWGPVTLLQTTPGNADLIRFYASSVPDPVAFGFFADADWNISHDTSEIQPFFERGLPGMALEDPTAFIGKHTAADNVENIKAGSLQQMGEQTLALARSFGEKYQTQDIPVDSSYFTLWKIGVVHYPALWNIIPASLAMLGLVSLIVVKIKRKAFSGGSLALSAIFLLLATLLAGLAGLGGNSLFMRLFPNTNPNIGSYLNFASLPFFLFELIAVILIYLIIRAWLSKRLGASAVVSGGLLVWVIFTAVSVALLRVGSYIVSIPLLAAVLAQCLPEKWKLAGLVPAAIATILIAPNIMLAYLGTGMQTLVLVNILVVLNMELWIGTES